MSEAIRVAVRIRDLLPRERDLLKKEPWWQWEGAPAHQIWPSGQAAKKFTFDRVYPPPADNAAVYAGLIAEGIESVVQGFNTTVFAYGQTASGKTHTMLGTESDPGLIRRSIDTIFQRISELSQQKEFLMRVSYLEIYNEHVNDLFVEPKKRKKVVIREDANGNTVFDNLEEIPICAKEDIFTLMDMGQQYRRVGETNMNERSSRSHTILRLIVESSTVEVDEDAGEDSSSTTGTAITVSHLNLVDLAGSERANQTGAMGERLREGSNINKSLLVLGQVISKLSEGSKEHIPFRESKLTRILKDSLGGNAKTTIICTVTPAEREQTKSTLEFASRAKTIVQHVHKNEFLDNGAELVRLKKEIKALSEALEHEKQKKGTAVEIKVVEEPTNDHSEELKQIELKRIQLLQDLRDKILKPVESDPKTRLDVIKKNRAKEDFKRRQSWHPAALNQKRLSLGLALRPAKNEVSIDEEFQLRLASLQATNSRTQNGDDDNDDDDEDQDGHEADRLLDHLELRDTLSDLPQDPIMDLFPDCIGFNELNEDLITERRSSKRRRRVRFTQEEKEKEDPHHKPEGDDDNDDVNDNDDNLESPRQITIPRKRRPSHLLMALDLDTSGTPRTILKDRIKLKDDTIKKLSSEFRELEEFTRMENEVLEEEKKRIELKAVEDMKRSLNTLKHEKSLLEGRLEDMKAEKAKAEQRLKFLQEENEGFWLAKYQGEKTSRRQSEIESEKVLLRDFDSALMDVQDLKNTINDLKSAIDRKEVDCEKKIEAIQAACETQIRDSQCNPEEIQIMREKCVAYEEQIQTLMAISNETSRENLRETELLAQLQEQERSHLTRIQDFESQIEELKSSTKHSSIAANSLDMAHDAKIQEVISDMARQEDEFQRKTKELESQMEQITAEKESALNMKDQELEDKILTLANEQERVIQEKESRIQELLATQNASSVIEERKSDQDCLLEEAERQVSKLSRDFESRIQAIQIESDSRFCARETELLSQVRECEGKIQTLLDASTLHETKIQALEADKEALLKSKDQELLEWQTTRDELARKLEEKEEESQRMSQELEEHLQNKQELIQTIGKLETDLQTVNKDKKASQEHVSNEYEAQIQSIQRQAENQLAQEQAKVTDLEEQASLMSLKLSETEDALAVLKETLAEEKLKVADLTNQAQSNMEEQVLRQRCQELQEVINTLESDIVKESAAKEDHHRQVQSLQESQRIGKQEKQDLEVQLDLKQGQLESLNDEIQDLKKQELETTNSVKVQLEQLQDQNACQSKTLEEYQRQVVSLQGEVEALRAQKKNEELHWTDQVASLTRKIQDLQQLKSSSDESLSQGIQAKNDLIQEYQTKLQSLSQEIEEWKTLEEGFLRSKDSFDLAICNKNQENQALTAKLQESESEIQSFRDVCENLSAQISEEKAKSEDFRRQVLTWESKAENFQRLQQDLATLREERTEFEGLSEFAKSVQKDLENVQDTCQSLKEELEAERRKNGLVVVENQSFRQELETLRSSHNQEQLSVEAIKDLESRNQDLVDELESAQSFEKLANNLQQAVRDKQEALEKISVENASLKATLQDLSNPTKVPELEAKLHEALIENATLKVKVEREDLEFKKKCKVLSENLAFEKDEVHSLRDKLRRVQREKMDATIMPMSRSHSIDGKPTTHDAHTMTNAEEQQSLAKINPGSPELNEKEAFEKVMAKYEKGYWSQGSGIVKDYALDVAKARIGELERKCTNFKDESNHYESKAREWKKEALQLRHNQKKLQEKLARPPVAPSASAAPVTNKPKVAQMEVLQESQTLNKTEAPLSGIDPAGAGAGAGSATMTKAPATPDEDAELIANFKLDFNKCDPDPFRKMPKTPKKTPMKKKLSTPMKENCKQQ